VKLHLDEIKKLIDCIPETFNGIPIISKIIKEYYFKTFELRLTNMTNIK